MFWLKLKAGALQLTLFIIVIIALILTTFILLVHTHKQFQIQSNFIVETTKNSNLGINYVMHESIPLNDTIMINPNSEDYKSLKVHRDFWGAFERVTSISQVKKNTFKKVAFVGGKPLNRDRVALYVQDNGNPLFVSGSTKIEGLSYIPSRGVNFGIIPNTPYLGSEPIYGKTRVSNKLPKLSTELINNLKSLINAYLDINSNQFLMIETGKIYSNSFFEPTEYVYSNTNINLDNIRVTGNIIIQSKTKIIVNSSAILKDVILIAPEIEILDFVKGTFQSIASLKIHVGNHISLDYPSSLILKESFNLDISNVSYIKIGSNSTIKGQVIAVVESDLNNYDLNIEIDRDTLLEGELYCTGNLELKGGVYGSVYANNFITRMFSSSYQNHIHNAIISESKLPEDYIGLLFKGHQKGIMKWLY